MTANSIYGPSPLPETMTALYGAVRGLELAFRRKAQSMAQMKRRLVNFSSLIMAPLQSKPVL